MHQYAGVMELADVVDSKSTGSDTVPVRVRPPAPLNFRLYICREFFFFRYPKYFSRIIKKIYFVKFGIAFIPVLEYNHTYKDVI